MTDRKFTPRQPGFRAHRAAAMTTAAANTFAYIAWDTVQEATGVTLVSQTVFKPDFNGYWIVEADATIASGNWQEFRLVVEIDQGSGFAVRSRCSVPGATIGLGLIQMGAGTAKVTKKLQVLAGQQMRCGVLTVGASNVALVPGAATLWISMIRMGPLRQGTS